MNVEINEREGGSIFSLLRLLCILLVLVMFLYIFLTQSFDFKSLQHREDKVGENRGREGRWEGLIFKVEKGEKNCFCKF